MACGQNGQFIGVAELKQKYETSESNLSTLKKLAHTAICDYEELQRKYDQNQKQYEELKVRLQVTEAELVKLQQLYEPVYDEYNELNVRYEIEKGCRNEAEKYASQVNKQNTKLKRQSQKLISQLGLVAVDIDLVSALGDATSNDASDEEVLEPQSQQDHWSAVVGELQSKIAELLTRLRKTESDCSDAQTREAAALQKYEAEREKQARTAASLKQHESTVKQFHRVSLRAFDEYSELRERFEQEAQLKAEAEKYASQMLSERQTMARESAVLLCSAASDERLTAALRQIEELSSKLEEEKQERIAQVKELSEAQAAGSEVARARDLEEQLTLAMEEIEMMRRREAELIKSREKLEKDNIELASKLDDAEERLKPPPPPPAPPLPPGGVFTPLHSLWKKSTEKTKRKPTGDNPQDERYTEAIKEMMDRIKSGRTLRKVSTERAPLPETKNSAMDDLRKMLSVRRLNSTGSLTSMTSISTTDSSAADGDGVDNELAYAFNKILGATKERNLSLITEEEDTPSVGRRQSGPDAIGTRPVLVLTDKPSNECSRL